MVALVKKALAISLLALAALNATAGAQTPPCGLERTSPQAVSDDNPAASYRVRVRSGFACTIRGSGSAGRYELVNPPAHGTLAVDGASAVYSPNAGFAGSDAFVLRYRLASSGTNHPWFMTFNVEVFSPTPVAPPVAAPSATPRQQQATRPPSVKPAAPPPAARPTPQQQATPQSAPPRAAQEATHMDAATRLRQLQSLHDQHLITDEEYQTRRRQILDSL
jgi:hypothetical protein